MTRLFRWLPLVLILSAVGVAKAIDPTQAQFHYIHYNFSSMPCGNDSMVGGTFGNCTHNSTVKWLNNATSIGVGDGVGVHTAKILEQNPGVNMAYYETISDEPYGDGTAWHEFLENYPGGSLLVPYYEQSFMHWRGKTVVCRERNTPTHACFGVEYDAGDKVEMYAPLTTPTGSVLYTINSCTANSCSGNENVYDDDDAGTSHSGRFAMCFSDSVAGDRTKMRQLFKEYLATQAQTRGDIPNSNEWFGGVFLDNASWDWFNWGESVGNAPGGSDGGEVREGPDNIMTYQGQSTWGTWRLEGPTSGAGTLDFYRALRDTFALGANWYNGGKRIFVDINCANSWYVYGSPNLNPPWSGNEADAYFAELQLSLNRANDPYYPLYMANAAYLLHIGWTSSANRCSRGLSAPCAGGSNCIPYSQLVYGAYALYRATNSGDDEWSMQYHTTQGEYDMAGRECPASGDSIAPSDLRWRQKNWVTAIDWTLDSTKESYLGDATGDITLHKNGTYTNNGVTTAYRIYRRPFERGWVWVRMRDGLDTPTYTASFDSVDTKILMNFNENSSGAPDQYIIQLDGHISQGKYAGIYLPSGRGVMTINSGAPDCCDKSWPCCEEIEP